MKIEVKVNGNTTHLVLLDEKREKVCYVPLQDGDMLEDKVAQLHALAHKHFL